MDAELKTYLDEEFAGVNKRFEAVVTRDELTRQLVEQTETLKAYADEQTEKLAAIIATTIAEPMEKGFAELRDYKTVQEKVLTLEADMRKIKTALQIG